MKKKMISLALSALFAVTSAIGCANGKNPGSDGDPDSAESPEQTPTPAAVSTWTSQYIRGLLSGAAILVTVVVGGLLWQHTRRKRGRHE